MLGVAGRPSLINEDGLLVAAKSDLLECILDPYHAELMACKGALTWIKDNGWVDVEVLSDCLNACNSINQASSDRSYIGEVIFDYRSIIHSLQGVSISYIPRAKNGMAHNLAKSAGLSMEIRPARYWVFNPPKS